ncbi:hypothetical protein [Phenylobacterium soli]|uniref:hypothetical protein n=1 Tax=Phenylobacterium soli TaxID=2170551 RepID=UPI0010583114|nr:hypothetical protein [Phenylobacterium soli]
MTLTTRNSKEERVLRRIRAKEEISQRMKAAGMGVKLPKRGFKRAIRERDHDYLSWLHGVPCIACRILGPAPAEHAYIEAAHQKAQDAARGWNKRLGVRPDDAKSAPLCAWHHRLGPNRCDPAQSKFWSGLNVDVIAFCEALFSAFREGRNGSDVVEQYSEIG